MKLLVIGNQGQLARSIAECSANHSHIQVKFVGRPEVDLSIPGAVAQAIISHEPNVVINAAAYTAVDKAEDEPKLAMRINADAAGEAAMAARTVCAAIIQVSTDYVFDGSAVGPYREDAPTNPLGVYGRSKLAGEEQVRAANPDHLIVRTSWVYSPWGKNFVKTMLRLAEQREEVKVVADQFGTPTSALDLAAALFLVLEQWRQAPQRGLGQTYHFAGAGRCSWADFAEEIFRVSGLMNGPIAKVIRIATADFPTRAARPANSQLDSSGFGRDFNFSPTNWQDSLCPVVERLISSKAAD